MEHAEGEPTGDGRVIVYYDKRGKVVAVEIANITALQGCGTFMRCFGEKNDYLVYFQREEFDLGLGEEHEGYH